MRSFGTKRSSFPIPLLMLAVAAGLPASAPPPLAAEETFTDTAQVIEVQVPVYVIGKDGEPIRGLTRDDFQILDEKQPREISQFQVIDLEILATGSSRTEVNDAVAAAARRHILLLFDLSFSKPTSIVRAREAARQFVLEELHPTDLVAVGTHSVEGGARLLVTFTPDRAQVARAIDTLGAPRLLNLRRRDPLRFLIEDPESAGTVASRDLSDPTQQTAVQALQESVIAHIRVVANEIAKAEKSFARGRISSWSRSMGELARMLAAVQGRKHVVFFSEGWDGQLLLGREPSAFDPANARDLQNIQSGQYWMVDTDDIYGNTGLQADIRVMLDEFRRADCVIQAVDISGLTADSAATERLHRSGQHALFYISDDTGGELFEDANDFGPELAKVLKHSSVTYLLTFNPEEIPFDGAFRRLKVKVDLPRPGRVVARQGYYAPRPYEQVHPFERNLLAADAIASAEPKSDLALNVLAAPFRASEGSAYVPIIIEATGTTLLAGQDERDDLLSVEFFAYVTDENGEMKDFFTQLVQMSLTGRRSDFARTGLKYYGHLDLEPGDHLIRVLVRNSKTGRSGVESLPLTIPSYRQAQPVLLPPFFLETNRGWFLVREQSPTTDNKVIYPFTVNGEPYIPAARPALAPGDEARICLVAYNLGQGELEMDGTIVTADGRRVEGGELALVERTVTGIEGLDKLLATFRPGGLDAGSYTLQVALTDPGNGSTEITSIPFELRRR